MTSPVLTSGTTSVDPDQEMRVAQFVAEYEAGLSSPSIQHNTRFGPHFRDRVVVELGCSRGLESALLHTLYRPRLLVAIDEFRYSGGAPYNFGVLKNAARRLKLDRLRVVKADIFRLPLRENSVDVLFVSQTLHHLIETKERFRNGMSEEIFWKARELFMSFFSALAPGGLLVVREQTRHNMIRYFWRYVLLKAYKRIVYPMKHQPDEWRYLLSAGGFRQIDAEYTVPARFTGLAAVIGSKWANFLFSTSYILFAKKQELD